MNKVTREEFADVVKTSGIKPRLKRELRFVPGEIIDWQLRDFIAVTNKSKTEGVLIADRDVLVAVPFKLERRAASNSGRVEAIICDICASWQCGSNSAAITFTKEKSTTTYLVCQDLDCSLHVRDKTPQAVLSRAQLREHLTPEERVERLRRRLFAIVDSLH